MVFERVDTSSTMNAAIARENSDIVVTDYSVPHFSVQEAMKLLKPSGHDVPVIIISGTIGIGDGYGVVHGKRAFQGRDLGVDERIWDFTLGSTLVAP